MKISEKILKNILTLIALISLCGGAVYKFYSLNIKGVIFASLISIVLYFIIQYLAKKHNQNSTKEIFLTNKKSISNFSIRKNFTIINYLFFVVIAFFILIKNTTASSIISPWEIVSDHYFVVYFLATLALLIHITKNNNFTLPLLSIHYLLSFSVALIIYKIGYGFDPFIHQASVDYIDKFGEITPKPFYYLGQYSLVVIFHKIFHIPISIMDKLLVPLAASIFLPFSIRLVLKKWFQNKKFINLTLLFLLIFPASFLIVTTPQNLSYIFFLVVVAFGIICKNPHDLLLVYLFSFTTLAIHPIAGIPAILYSLMLTVYHSDIHKYKNIIFTLLFLLSVFALPFAFSFINSASSEAPGGGAIDFALPQIEIPQKENALLNFSYLFGFNYLYLFLLFMIAGIIIFFKHKRKSKSFTIPGMMSLAMIVSFFITRSLPFQFLIEYERSNYSNRLLIISAIFLLPFILSSLYGLIIRIFKQDRWTKNIILIFLAILITVSHYFSHPRHDNYHNSHGISVGEYDRQAVRWIEDDSKGDYIVLANQQVSAASLREFGFAKYYETDSEKIFYYPIPTGGQLYKYYLDMVYEYPSKKTITEAMDKVGVDTGYFVLNKYWWAYKKILEEAKLEANSYEKIGNGEIYVFKYLK